MTFYRAVEGGLTLAVRVTPKASQTAITGTITMPEGVALKVAVSAPPDKGKANHALCELIAAELGLPKSSVSVMSGATDRRKVLHVSGPTAALMAAVQKWKIA